MLFWYISKSKGLLLLCWCVPFSRFFAFARSFFKKNCLSNSCLLHLFETIVFYKKGLAECIDRTLSHMLGAGELRMGTSKNSEKTREKLVEAAGRLFAERGYKRVTVRDIVQKAETHLSALNYHFGSKEELYREALLKACSIASFSPGDQEALLKLEPREALYIVISESLKQHGEKAGLNWENDIITRECWEPSDVFNEVSEKYLKPQTGFIAHIIGKIAGKPPDDPKVLFAVIVLIGMTDTFGEYGHLIDAVAPNLAKNLKHENMLARELLQTVIGAAKTSVDE